MSASRNSLQPGYRLHWYVIREVLGQGGFGITYLADDTNLNQAVAIKEYLPIDMAVRERDSSVHPVSGEHGDQFRWGLDRFMSEARTLARFKHPNIVRVFSVFAGNNTAYMVMEYERGRGFHQVLKQCNSIPEQELKAIILPILDGLEEIHSQGFIHRDIKPANIFIREDGSPVLLDFGSARQSFGEHTHTLTAMVSPGFAPFEQYSGKGERQGPWTDIYGLGATLYRAAVGRSPADAIDRSEALLHGARDIYVPAAEIAPPGYSLAFLVAVDSALAFRPDTRPQSVAEWRNALTGIVSTAPTEVAPAVPGKTPPAARQTSALKRASLTLLVLLGLAVGLGALKSARKTSLPAAAGPAAHAAASNGNAAPAKSKQAAHAAGTAAGPVPGANPPTPVRMPPTAGAATLAADENNLIAPRDRLMLKDLAHDLRGQPETEQTRRKLRFLVGHFQRTIRDAVEAHDYDRAEAYVLSLLKLAPNNTKLRDAARRIELAKQNQSGAQ